MEEEDEEDVAVVAVGPADEAEVLVVEEKEEL